MVVLVSDEVVTVELACEVADSHPEVCEVFAPLSRSSKDRASGGPDVNEADVLAVRAIERDAYERRCRYGEVGIQVLAKPELKPVEVRLAAECGEIMVEANN